jgi:hypothetical protein
MALTKKELKAALVLLSVSFSEDDTNSILEDLLAAKLTESLVALSVEFPTDASTETLLELYTVATIASGSDEIYEPEDSEFFDFKAKVGFRQPWKGGSFNKAKDEDFDEDDDDLIKHLLSNNLITRN